MRNYVSIKILGHRLMRTSTLLPNQKRLKPHTTLKQKSHRMLSSKWFLFHWFFPFPVATSLSVENLSLHSRPAWNKDQSEKICWKHIYAEPNHREGDIRQNSLNFAFEHSRSKTVSWGEPTTMTTTSTVKFSKDFHVPFVNSKASVFGRSVGRTTCDGIKESTRVQDTSMLRPREAKSRTKKTG